MTNHDHSTPTDRTVTHPRGHCDDCGEPLTFTPCLNCGDRAADDAEVFSDG
jgi:hypothetical protein